jgi:hypothetical protein
MRNLSKYLIAIVALACISLAAAPMTLAAIMVDGKYDPGEGYGAGSTIYFNVDDGDGNTTGPFEGTLYQHIDLSTNDLYLAFVLPTEVNDTSYGQTSADHYGWQGKGRKFGQIVGSDHIQVNIMSTTGQVILSALIDALAEWQVEKKGAVEYHTTGVYGNDDQPGFYRIKQGDGKMLVGDSSSFLGVATSFDYNYNLAGGTGFKDTEKSPAPNTFEGWIDEAIYEMHISGEALEDDLGNLIFSSASMNVAHLSPAKEGGGTPPTPSVPEPGTMLLFGTGLAGMAWYRRRKGARSQKAETA